MDKKPDLSIAASKQNLATRIQTFKFLESGEHNELIFPEVSIFKRGIHGNYHEFPPLPHQWTMNENITKGVKTRINLGRMVWKCIK